MKVRRTDKMETEIIRNDDGTTVVKVSGRLDTMTSTQLEEKLDGVVGDATDLTFDFADLEYISSAGLRIILSTHKLLAKKGGGVKVINCLPDVKEVFSITGFSDILPIS